MDIKWVYFTSGRTWCISCALLLAGINFLNFPMCFLVYLWCTNTCEASRGVYTCTEHPFYAFLCWSWSLLDSFEISRNRLSRRLQDILYCFLLELIYNSLYSCFDWYTIHYTTCRRSLLLGCVHGLQEVLLLAAKTNLVWWNCHLLSLLARLLATFLMFQSMSSVYLCFVNWDDCKCVRYEIVIYDPYIYYGVLDMQIEMIVNVYEKRWFCVRYAKF